MKSLSNSNKSRPPLARADYVGAGADGLTVGVNGLKLEALSEALRLFFGLNSCTSAIEMSIMLLFIVMSILLLSWSTVSQAVVFVFVSEVESSFVKSVFVCGKTELENLLLDFGLNSSQSIPKLEFLF